MTKDLLIWWTEQECCELIESSVDTSNWPKYLVEQLDSRHGRAGRNRLWCAEELDTNDEVEVSNWDQDKAEAVGITSDCGGIVIRSEDVKHCFCGVVTDFDLNYVTGRNRGSDTSVREVYGQDYAGI